MSLAKGDTGVFKRTRRGDSFKISLLKVIFNYNLIHIFCIVKFCIHVAGSAKCQEKREFWPPHSCLLSYIWVSVKCGFLVWVWRALHNGGATREHSCAVVSTGCGRTGWGDEALVFHTWTLLPPNDCLLFENYR